MRFLKKFSLRKRIYLLLSLILCLLLGGIGIFLLTKPQGTGAAWWDETWLYRREINLNNPNSEIDNAQIKIFDGEDLSPLVNEGKLDSTLKDLRFTDSSGNLLPYYIENDTNSAVEAWVLIRSLIEGPSTIFMYYGKSSATDLSSSIWMADLGGEISSFGTYRIHAFTDAGSDTYTNFHNREVDILVVAGGGGGGYRHGAGGGAGGLIFQSNFLIEGNTSVLIGSGGNGATGTGAQAQSGENTSFGDLVSLGGGAGGQWDNYRQGLAGGSGGGSSTSYSANGTSGQGNNGGQGATSSSPYNWGGGGGAGEAGASGTSDSHGDGGDGLYYGDFFTDSYGENGWFAGGGGGGGHDPTATYRGVGGNGGGGDGGTPGTPENGGDGIATTGGGGGGASTSSGGSNRGGDGASGIVLLRYESDINTPTNISIDPPSSIEEITPGPIAFWKFDEGSGDTINDASGNGNSGTISTTTWEDETSCISGTCLDFPGGGSATIPHSNSLPIGTNSFTISGWALHQDYTYPKSNFMIKKSSTCYNAGTANAGFDIGHGYKYNGIDICIHDVSDNYIKSTLAFDTGSQPSELLNEWVHYTFVFDRTQDRVFAYVNGVKQTNELDISTITDSIANTRPITIGTMYGWLTDGLMDEIKIYAYARDEDQIKTDYITGSSATGSKVVMGSKTETSTTTPLSGKLLAHYRFDEGSGNTTYDTVNSQTGSVNGATWKAEGKYGKALDFAKNNESLMLDYMTWKDGQTGAVGSFGLNGTASENYRVVDTDPWGRKSVVWEARPDDVSGADGGWYHNLSSIDNTKTYRFSVWVNRKVTGNGSFYLGTNGYGSVAGVYYRSDGTTNTTNPYFWVGTPSQDTWTLVVAHVWPAGSGAGSNHPDSGRYTVADGYIGPISRDYIWRDETTSGRQRSYLYYSTNTDTRQQWIYPRVDIVDGTEPSIEELLNGYGAYGDDVFTEVAGTKESFSLWYDKDADGDWEHLVKSGSNYYVDGVLGTPAEFPLYNSANEVYVGRTSYSDYVTGIIDDVKIYNTTLTAEEVLLDYNQGRTTTLSQSPPSSGNIWGGSASSQYCIPGDTSTCSPPVGEWLLDDNQGSTAKDTSGNGNDGTLVNSPIWSKGLEGTSSLKFNGANSSVTVSDSIGLRLANTGFTISMWGYWDSLGSSSYPRLIDKSTGTARADPGWKIYFDSNRSAILGITGGGDQPGIIIPSQKWFHFAWTADGADWILYLNGKEVSKKANSYLPSDVSPDLNIGNSPVGERSWDGLIDQVRIYDYARTPAQIAWDYDRGKPVGHWRLDECQGSTIHDVTGNGNHGSITIGPTGTQDAVGTCTSNSSTDAWSNGKTGKLNSSLSLDGTDDQVVIPNSQNYQFGTKPFTISIWANPSTAVANYDVIFSKSSNLNHYEYVNSLFSAYGELRWYLAHNSETLWNHYVSFGANANFTNEWNHFLLVRDGTTIKGYLNGELADESTLPTDYDLSNSYDIQLGKEGSIGTYFDGRVDDLRIYNYALTPKQIQLLYNDNAAVRF